MLIKILKNLHSARIYKNVRTSATTRRLWQQLKHRPPLLHQPYKAVLPLKIDRRGQHSCPEDINLCEMDVKIMPALENNYMYLIIDKETREAAAVDPVDPMAIITALHKEKVTMTQVLTTHYHLDHAAGNKELRKMWYQQLTIYGGDDRIIALKSKVADGDRLQIGKLKVRCLYTPGHTTGDICYYVESPKGDRVVFTGDTLFQGGCGILFEGTPEQMYDALVHKLGELPDETLVFCGHENTVPNLSYAKRVEPQNKAIKRRLKWAQKRREENATTMPSSICEEKTWNPFMRVHECCVQEYTGLESAEEVFEALRKERDDFKLDPNEKSNEEEECDEETECDEEAECNEKAKGNGKAMCNWNTKGKEKAKCNEKPKCDEKAECNKKPKCSEKANCNEKPKCS